jgi:putative transposase
MPRKARIDAPGALHHVICRGIERRHIFDDDEDRDSFVDRLGDLVLGTSTRCHGWALVDNHAHLLLRTGRVPIATVMRRLLTGYAVTYNRRHRRYGHLFQNRYKSILCQEDSYLLELVRYIHLNPLRARLVSGLEELDRYPYCGHSRIMGKLQAPWQDTDAVLSLFSDKVSEAQRRYRDYVAKGIDQGRKPGLVGGGLIRGAGGWKAVKSLRKRNVVLKGDERILGDSDFVQAVLEAENENLERRYRLEARGYGIEKVIDRVAELFGIESGEVVRPGKQPLRAKARAVVCYWAVRELGMTTTAVGKRLGLTQPAVSKAVQRGENLAEEDCLALL